MSRLSLLLRWVLCFWFAAGVAVSVRTFLHPMSHTVFPVYYFGSIHWWYGDPVYADYFPIDRFRYPPIFAILLTPLAALGPTLGGILWSWLSLVVYGWGCWRFLRDVIPRRWSETREAIFLGLALFAALRGLWNSQSNALVCGLLLIGCADAIRERWWRSSLFLALAVLVKLTPLVIVLLILFIRPWQLVPRVTLFLLLGALLPFLTQPTEIVLEQHAGWLTQIRETSRERWPGFRDAWTVWTLATDPPNGNLVEYFRRPIPGVGYQVAQLVTGALAWLWVLSTYRQPLNVRLLLAYGVGSGWLLLFGPSVEHPTFVLLAPVLLWGLLEERRRWLIGLAALLILVLGWGAVTEPLVSYSPWFRTALPLGTFLYLLWLLWFRTVPSAILPART